MVQELESKPSVEQIAVVEKDAVIPQRAGDLHLLDDYGNTRRIPIPSEDPNDPLNFTKWRKLGILVSCCWFSIFSLALVGGIGPIIPVFLELYLPQGKSVDEIISLSTYPSVTMACGRLILNIVTYYNVLTASRSVHHPAIVNDVWSPTNLPRLLCCHHRFQHWCREKHHF